MNAPAVSNRRLTMREVILVVGAFVFPPLPVYLVTGISSNLLLCFLLTLFAQIPGILYAFYVIWDDFRYGNSRIQRSSDLESGVLVREEIEEEIREPTPTSTQSKSNQNKNSKFTDQGHTLGSNVVISNSSSNEHDLPPRYESVVDESKVPLLGDHKIQHE